MFFHSRFDVDQSTSIPIPMVFRSSLCSMVYCPLCRGASGHPFRNEPGSLGVQLHTAFENRPSNEEERLECVGFDAPTLSFCKDGCHPSSFFASCAPDPVEAPKKRTSPCFGSRPLLLGRRPSLLGWRPFLLPWRPLPLGWRPSLLESMPGHRHRRARRGGPGTAEDATGSGDVCRWGTHWESVCLLFVFHAHRFSSQGCL